MTPEIVKVRVKDPRLRKTYGETMHLSMEKAVRGALKGLWSMPEGVMPAYETAELRPASTPDNEGYLTKQAFDSRPRGSRVLSYRDVWHEDKKK